ncbi:MAG: exo-beta-N-acetylmuramidase NamZ domain-containing protein [Pirellulaceae bacterium]
MKGARDMRWLAGCALLVLWNAAQGWAEEPSRRLPCVDPGAAGMSQERLQEIETVVREALDQHCMPGCVVAIGRHGQLVYLRAFGERQTTPIPLAMTTDTIFDLASLTKPIATATSVLLLVERGQLDLDGRVAGYLPEFGRNGKEAITVRQLLTHQGGLTPDNALADYADGPAQAWERICGLGVQSAPGTKFTYSDVGFIVLGELVRRVSGEGLDQFSQQQLFRPLGMRETTFLPGESLRARAAPTEKREDRWMQGEVHDPRAYLLGGIAGHAGLFSSAEDLALYAQMMLDRGTGNGGRVLAAQSIDMMTADYPVSTGIRGLGWDKRTGYSTNRGDGFSPSAFGHGGFTGTTLWIDPQLDLFVIFLSNRVHPAGQGSVNQLAGKIGTLAAASIVLPASNGDVRSQQPIPHVLCGIDVLQRDNFQLLAGRRVGLITNHTGVNLEGTTTARLLADAPEVRLTAIFSPEHGLEGKLDVPRIDDSQHGETGVKIWSLYGETRRPTAASLEGLDTLVFDVQDIGTRFYTYISTLAYAMQAADENKLTFVVLDRPNPINGRDVAGPVLDAGRESFVACHAMPVRHGMTVGELATMYRDELGLSLDLRVVKLEGWRRSDFYDRTGLVWINPSPNMRSLTQALLYPGIGLLETTNLSVGRGTDTPFEICGAPWLDGRRLAAELNAAALPGTRFVPVRFTPDSSKFAGEACQGVNVIITDWSTFDPLWTGLAMASTLRTMFREQWDVAAYDRLLLDQATGQAVSDGQAPAEIMAVYHDELEQFKQRRKKWLLYE